MRRKLALLGLTAVLAFSAACAPNPEKDIITGKNEGVFDVNAWISADSHHAPGDTISFVWNEEMESSDGSVKFSFDLDQQEPALDMPVVQVTVYYPTDEEIRQIAHSLYGEADYWENQIRTQQQFSKSEIQEMLDRWEPYVSEEGYKSIFGSLNADKLRIIQNALSNYQERQKTAPDVPSRQPCLWAFRNIEYYTMTQEQLDAMKPSDFQKIDSIQAEIRKNGVYSTFASSVYRGSEYKLSNVVSFISNGVAPMSLNERIFTASLCRTEAPTKETDAAVRARAEQILADCNLGDWYIDSMQWRVSETYGTPEYSCNIFAVPVLNGVSAVPQESDYSAVYASSIAQTSVEMRLSPNGDILFFYMRSPLLTEKVINENVSVIDFEALKEKARTYFRYTDKLTYSSNPQFNKVNIVCNIHINRVRYGLVRIRVANQEGSYYYAPGIVFYGTVEYVDKLTGKPSPVSHSDREVPLLVLNCVDGTVVNGTNT